VIRSNTGSSPLWRIQVVNATGVTVITVALAEKRVEVLRDAVPGLGRLAVLHDPTFPPGQIELGQITAAAAALNVQVHPVGA
jgi:putative ABC transport system substrate-binding protein